MEPNEIIKCLNFSTSTVLRPYSLQNFKFDSKLFNDRLWTLSHVNLMTSVCCSYRFNPVFDVHDLKITMKN